MDENSRQCCQCEVYDEEEAMVEKHDEGYLCNSCLVSGIKEGIITVTFEQ